MFIVQTTEQINICYMITYCTTSYSRPARTTDVTSVLQLLHISLPMNENSVPVIA